MFEKNFMIKAMVSVVMAFVILVNVLSFEMKSTFDCINTERHPKTWFESFVPEDSWLVGGYHAMCRDMKETAKWLYGHLPIRESESYRVIYATSEQGSAKRGRHDWRYALPVIQIQAGMRLWEKQLP